MSSSLTLIQAISPTLIGLSFLLPFLYGWFRKKWFSALIIGCSLSILSSFLKPIYQRLIQIEMISNDSTDIIEISQPNLTLVIALSWILPLSGYLLGQKFSESKRDQ